jgi:hypothetical protein
MIASSSLRAIADSATSAVVAVLLLIAIVVFGYGLVRALVLNRRTQIVVADLVVPDSSEQLAQTTTLSSVERQYVQRQVNDQREQVIRIGRTILSQESKNLEPRLQDTAVEGIQRAATDSIATLSVALRAVTPDTADRFLALFSVILPPPRGISVSVMLLQRGSNAEPRLGAAVELVRLDCRPVASTMFWEPVSTVTASISDEPSFNERLLALFEPITRWIAIRLIVSLMVSARHRGTSRNRQGLKRLLAGGLFLASMREYPEHALAFGEEACIELKHAQMLMPTSPLPTTTLAGVHERMGWAWRLLGKSEAADVSFGEATRLWKVAENLIVSRPGAKQEVQLAIIVERRLKAQLDSDDSALRDSALAALSSLSAPTELLKSRVWLYNRACLFAQANRADPSEHFQSEALHWLGRALMLAEQTSLWGFAELRDPELTPIQPVLGQFIHNLRELVQQKKSPLSATETETEALIAEALASVT